MEYPQTIETGMKLPTLGTLIPQTFEMEGVVPKAYLQNVNIQKQGVAGQAQSLGFTVPLFQSTAEEYLSSARSKDLSELQEQRMAGVDPKTSYFSFSDTNSNPKNFNWSTTPMDNLGLSKSTVPYKYADSWTSQKPSRSEYRTTMGDQIMAENTKLRSVRLY
jgi:hypothetical protein